MLKYAINISQSPGHPSYTFRCSMPGLPWMISSFRTDFWVSNAVIEAALWETLRFRWSKPGIQRLWRILGCAQGDPGRRHGLCQWINHLFLGGILAESIPINDVCVCMWLNMIRPSTWNPETGFPREEWKARGLYLHMSSFLHIHYTLAYVQIHKCAHGCVKCQGFPLPTDPSR